MKRKLSDAKEKSGVDISLKRGRMDHASSSRVSEATSATPTLLKKVVLPPTKVTQVTASEGKEEKKEEKKKKKKTIIKKESASGAVVPLSYSSAFTTKSIVDRYRRQTLLENILARPDTYVGSKTYQSEELFVYEEESKRMVKKRVRYVPALLKIFDEILVNAADHRQRDPSMTELKVMVSVEDGTVTIRNNGHGISSEMHQEYKLHVPELVFGELLAGENYDDDDQRTTGGRNGYGAKLANIFSTVFSVDTCDQGKRYTQTWSQNMTVKAKHELTDVKTTRGYTQITFHPDFTRFGMTGFDADIVALMQKRTMDMAGVLPKNVKVWWNGSRIELKGFQDYCRLYLPPDAPCIVSKMDRWEVVISKSPSGTLEHTSFVNAISTTKGGTHVAAVCEPVKKAMVAHIKKKFKNSLVKPSHVTNHLWVFINCICVNPRFDSQTKLTLTSQRNEFGSKWEIDDAFIKKLAKSELIPAILESVKGREEKELKKTDGKKRGGRVLGIPKLEDANKAGTREAQECTLCLTEGDSAKAFVMAGLSVVGRDHYGVFPLKGKLLNTRDCSYEKFSKNDEITSIKQILGLQSGKEYKDTSSLRYGSVTIVSDQDVDGSHIKGLVINLFATKWPSLVKIPGFIKEIITPIVRANKGRLCHSFFTIPQYEAWKAEQDRKGWNIKYYKGLGTSTPLDAKECFAEVEKHTKVFVYDGPSGESLLNMAFSKTLANMRKQWLGDFKPGTFLDMSVSTIPYSDFVNKELILYSMSSNIRSIPSVVDGLKPGQRKILYCCFKRNLIKEIKVAQLAGYVSEHASYHHGEASLHETIVKMAQNFVGSNNINVLYPSGQFGTRAEGGGDAASARYIFTHLCPITRTIFHPDDDHLLTYLDDDGQPIEPEWYMPVLPMVLINGSSGIGTGWSTSVPNYNPREIVANIRRIVDGEPPLPMDPWWKRFNGTIEARTKGGYTVRGIMETTSETSIRITELPILTWTSEYRTKVLERQMNAGVIRTFTEHHTDTTVEFRIQLSEALTTQELEESLKLTETCHTSNMVLFDRSGKLKKYTDPIEILNEFCTVRLEFYEKRKAWLQVKLQSELKRISNRLRFILAVIADELKVRNVKKSIIIQQLVEMKFDPWTKTAAGETRFTMNHDDPATEEDEKEEEETEEGKESKEEKKKRSPRGTSGQGFDYLLSMPIWSLTLERVEQLKKEHADKQHEIEILMATTIQDMWKADLDAFMVALDEHEKREDMELESGKKIKPKNRGRTPKVKSTPKARAKAKSKSRAPTPRSSTAHPTLPLLPTPLLMAKTELASTSSSSSSSSGAGVHQNGQVSKPRILSDITGSKRLESSSAVMRKPIGSLTSVSV